MCLNNTPWLQLFLTGQFCDRIPIKIQPPFLSSCENIHKEIVLDLLPLLRFRWKECQRAYTALHRAYSSQRTDTPTHAGLRHWSSQDKRGKGGCQKCTWLFRNHVPIDPTSAIWIIYTSKIKEMLTFYFLSPIWAEGGLGGEGQTRDKFPKKLCNFFLTPSLIASIVIK